MGSGLLAAVLSGLATSLGALPFLFMRELPRRAYDGILGLGAGLMLAAATLGLLAEAVHGVRADDGLDVAKLALVIAGFGVGVGLAAAMDRFIPHHHAGGHHEHLGHEPGHDVHDRRTPPTTTNGSRRRGTRTPSSARSACTASPKGSRSAPGSPSRARPLGILLAIAVGVQNACEGIVMSAPLRQGGVSPRRGFASSRSPA